MEACLGGCREEECPEAEDRLDVECFPLHRLPPGSCLQMLVAGELAPWQARDRKWEEQTFRGVEISPCRSVQPDLVALLQTVVRDMDRCRVPDRKWEERTWQGGEGPRPRVRAGSWLRTAMVEDLRCCLDRGRKWEERTWRQGGEKKALLFVTLFLRFY